MMKKFSQDQKNDPVGFIFLEVSRSLSHLLASNINFTSCSQLFDPRFDCRLHQLISGPSWLS